jgi:uncharacterized protein YecT (DUF1311 family)
MRLVPALALLLSAPPAPAAAQALDCARAQTQVEITGCVAAEWERADSALNAVYPRAVAALRDLDEELPQNLKGGVEALKDGQRAWISYRDGACAAEGFLMRGGSGESMLFYACLARLTEARTADLKALVEGFGY